MRFASIRERLSPRPIAHYALLFFFVLLVSLGVFAALVFHDTARLKDQIAQSEEKLARQELEEAIGLMTRQAEDAAQAMQPFVRHENVHDHLYFFYPFHQDTARTALAGYAGFKYDFQDGLNQLRKFRYLDLDSVRIALRDEIGRASCRER